MATVYFDASAFVKLLVEEDGSDIAAALWDGCDAAVSSRLAYPEVRAALAAAVHGRSPRAARADPLRNLESPPWQINLQSRSKAGIASFPSSSCFGARGRSHRVRIC